MITKIGMVGVGVLAGLAAVAPLASASESHGDHHGAGSCSVAGGDAGALNNGKVEGLGAIAQAPVGGANAANITCSPFLNDNVRDNLNGNTANLSIAGSDIPFELPGA